MTTRLTQLDSIRGLAALSVVAHHCLLVLPAFEIANPSSPPIRMLRFSIFHIFFAGTEAVLLFFVLSGFVLSLPYLSGEAPKYKDYLIRRVCRIYLPYLAAVATAIACRQCFYSGPVAGTSAWFLAVWADPPTFQNILDHIIFIESFKSAAFDPVLWSLVIEMRVSLAFPLLVTLVKRFDWLIFLVLTVACVKLPMWLQSHFFPNLGQTDYLTSLKYLPHFLLGILIAKHREKITTFLRDKTNSIFKWALLALGVVLYTCNHTHIFPVKDLFELVAGLGAGIFICLALGWKGCIDTLNKPVPQFLGRISYSLYLFHAIVLVSLIHTLHQWIPMEYLLVLSFFTSIGVSWIAYRLFEKPSIALGRYLTRAKPREQLASN